MKRYLAKIDVITGITAKECGDCLIINKDLFCKDFEEKKIMFDLEDYKHNFDTAQKLRTKVLNKLYSFGDGVYGTDKFSWILECAACYIVDIFEMNDNEKMFAIDHLLYDKEEEEKP